MELKTLTILTGNARGGEISWHSMYKNLLEPYNSDLALCFGETKDKSSSLYKKAKYVWELPEYENWRDYYSQVCNGYWEKSFSLGINDGVKGPIDGAPGSGAIVFGFRHFIKNNKKKILEEYDRIILVRSDFYYAYKQKVLSNDHIWIVEGEDYGGIGDRMYMFPSTMIDDVLGIVEYMDSEEGYNELLNYDQPKKNCETMLMLYFMHSGVLNKIKRFPRVNYLVSFEGDSTRWSKGVKHDPNNPELKIKYICEYQDCMDNITNKIEIL